MIYAVNKRTKMHRLDDGVKADEEVWVEADPDGWIEWHGGECPLPDGAFAEVRFRDHRTKLVKASNMLILWNHETPTRHDIIEYRPVLDADTKPKAPAWSGDGLPPVGARCEMLIAGWEEVFIAGMDSRGRAIAEVLSSGVLIPTKDADRFRPIRSAEYRSIEAIKSAMEDFPYDDTKQHLAELVHAAIRDGKVPGVKLEGSND